MILDDYFLQTESLSISVAGFSVVWYVIEENYTEKMIWNPNREYCIFSVV